MSKTMSKLPSFCLTRIGPDQSKSEEMESYESSNEKKKNTVSAQEKKPLGVLIGRKIMIVVDSSPEAEGALQWAFSHTVQNQDKVVLLYITKPLKRGHGSSKEAAPKSYQLVQSLKNVCMMKKPEVEILVEIVEGKERGPTIVEEARKQEVEVLILGQKKRSKTLQKVLTWAGQRGFGGAVEYCIENASCMAVAVRRKSKKLGGYLITTKRQKDFWLLA